jgi:hypothetical protein
MTVHTSTMKQERLAWGAARRSAAPSAYSAGLLDQPWKVLALSKDKPLDLRRCLFLHSRDGCE